ncbi:hypothetical protein HPB49_020360 [Dermacentor silvarum]|uniref:Uncharacterized protein n=1 Tax=Dermacentor silvarum TaxID=543639 RepID=A0ACB8DFS1_DERSI|nr:hypothetical protein HPB49_020360 [Dermacentor silvarum]
MFETFLLVSGASEFPPERRKALLLHSLGIEGQRNFFALPSHVSEPAPPASAATASDEAKKSPTAPSSYDQAVDASTQHFASASNVVEERDRFRRRAQQPGESIQEYVAALRELAASCSLVALDDSLRDQFFEDITSQHVHERLLLEGSSLSFSRAVLLAGRSASSRACSRARSAGNLTRRSAFKGYNATALVSPSVCFP